MAAPPHPTARWWAGGRSGSGAGRGRWAGIDSGGTPTGSAATGGEAGTGAGGAEGPAAGRTGGLLGLGHGGYTPAAVGTTEVKLLPYRQEIHDLIQALFYRL